MRVRFSLLLIYLAISSSFSVAQHVEIGGFASYGHFDLPPFPKDAIGLGGRLDINIASYLALEGEGSYDFEHPGLQIASSGSGSFTVTQFRLGVIHGNGGFKIQTKKGSYFLFFKGGGLQFRPDIRTSSLVGTLIGTPQRSGTNFSEAVFYPGGGIGFHAGPLGMRVDAGDEIYWDNGTHHNLRITFGPTIRF